MKYSILFSTKDLHYCREVKEFGKPKMRFIKIPLPRFTKKKQEFQKAISIPQKDLQKPRKLSNENILLFITFNPNHLHIHSTTKSLVNCLKNNNVSGFHNIKLT